MGFPVAGSGFAPGGGHEEHEHGKKLQPADEHIKGEHQLAEGAESRKVFGGADPGEPRPMLLIVAATAVKLVSSEKPSRLIANTERQKIIR